jgi:3-deoxy-D-manno-octulosonic-acid transferase
MLVLAETEFWPNLLNGCFRRGIPVAVVNARISDRSWPRYLRLRSLWQPFLSRLTRVLAQSELDAQRLRDLGCRPEVVSIAGNLKFDVRGADLTGATELLKIQAAELRLIVAGSTLQGEEAALLNAWPSVLASDPNLALVLAPRHPERFNDVRTLLNESGLRWVNRSSWPSHWAGAPRLLAPGEIVLLDTIGELASVYSLASVAFVGGSLIPAGGHNPLEPAQFSVPIVMGPHYANFRAIVDDLVAHQALRIATIEELASALVELLHDQPAASAMGDRALQVFEQQAGATARCLDALKALISPTTPFMSMPKPKDPAIELEARRLKHDGADTETILCFLREKGCGKIDSIKILRSVYGLGLADAKGIVDSSKIWQDHLGSDAALHERLWRELEEAANVPDSGITADESGGYVIKVHDESEEK